MRCCNDSGDGDSICPDGDYSTYDFQRAFDECNAVGMRLCTIQELIDNYSATTNTGCYYNLMNVWTSDFTNCDPPSTPSPTPKPTPDYGVCLYGTILGTPPSGSTIDDATYVDPTDATVAGMRCCNDSGDGDSICPDGDYSTYDFQRAFDECNAVGMRLCTIQELIDNYSATTGTGCYYNAMNVWTSDSSNCECFKRGIVRGVGATLEDATYVDPTDATVAGIRCCNDNGRGASICPDGNQAPYDFQRAIDECNTITTIGMRLCTIQEVVDNYSNIAGTGCWYDGMNIWTSDFKIC